MSLSGNRSSIEFARPRPLAATLIAAVLSFAGGDLRAQVAPCFDDEPAPPWSGVDVDLDSPGASRPLAAAGDADYELCSASGGFGGALDSFRFLTQPGDGDVTLLAVLEAIDPDGSAGLMARRAERDSAAAHVRIVVSPGLRGTYELHSAARLEPGEAASDEGSTPALVDLPLLLKIERRGSTITTFYDSEEGFVEHLSVDVAGSDLESHRLKYGMVQSSDDRALSASARFRRATLTGDDEPDPGIDCFPTDIAVPASGDTEATRCSSFAISFSAAIAFRLPSRTPASLPTRATSAAVPPDLEWDELTREDGTPLGAGDVLREGDVVIFNLRGAVADPERVTVLFGDTRAEVLPRSTPESLRLRIGRVPESGSKCPLLFESTSAGVVLQRFVAVLS